MIDVRWNSKRNAIDCILPITRPTSKVRIKRKGIFPVATRKEKLTKQDYIEWQISYQNNKTGELIEFGRIISIAFNKGIVSRKDIYSLINSIKDTETFEESYKISRRITTIMFNRFRVIYEKIPILRYSFEDGCYIDIALKHKQKAVGYQAMIYIYIPLLNVKSIFSDPLIGRESYTKERVIWNPLKDHILGLLRSFLIASKTHKKDIVENVIPKIVSK